MAITDSGFQFKYNLAGRTSGIQKSFPITGSETITVGDAIMVTDGAAIVSGASSWIMGIVVGLTDEFGIDMDNSKVTKDGTYTASTKTYAAASDNTTDKKFQVVVDIDPMSVYSAQPDAAIGTTNDSDKPGSFCDVIAASDQPDEDNTDDTIGMLLIWGTDPENTAHGLYSIAEHQIWAG